jgi:transglutaminase-like putative cysteine protease
MKLQVRHQTEYRYEGPVAYAIQTLRLSPRPYDGLSVISWRVQASGRGDLPSFIDGFGNLAHTHSLNREHDSITLLVEGEVETTDTAGIVRGGLEPLPEIFFLRTTPLTMADEAIRDLTAEAARSNSTLDRLHLLMVAVRERIDYELGVTDTTTTASEALRRGAGVCQDHAHVFISAARLLGIPARYVGGYLWTGAADRESEASHAWAEAYVEHLGWVGFDPSNRICPTHAYIRSSIGLDYASAAPVRGVRRGNSAESLAVRIDVSVNAEQ